MFKPNEQYFINQSLYKSNQITKSLFTSTNKFIVYISGLTEVKSMIMGSKILECILKLNIN